MFEPRCLLIVGMALAAVVSDADDDVLRDPTRPVTAVEVTTPARPAARYVVSAIFVGPDRRVAVVNGRTVGLGDRVGGARVVDIAPDRLILAVGGKTLTARLATTKVRR